MLPARRSPSPHIRALGGSGIQVSLTKNPESSTLNPESTAWNSLDSLTRGEISGGSREGLGGPGLPRLLLDETEARRAEKGFLETCTSWSQGLDDCPLPLPPYLKVWFRHWRSPSLSALK